MPPTTPDKLLKALASGRRPSGIFFLHGDEEYLKDEVASAIIAAYLDPATKDFNFDLLRGPDVEAETLASIANTPPMMAEHRVILVREAHALGTNAKLRAAVESLLERTPPELALILVATLPEKSKAQFWERLKREAHSAEFPALSQADLPGWLMERAAQRGLELDAGGARALAATGSDIGVLVQELDKLANFIGERRQITRDDVVEIVGSVPKQNRWDWIDIVADAKFREARAGLSILLDNGESGVGLVIALGTQFLRLSLAASGGEKALGSLLPPNQRWLAGKVARQARRWNAAALDAVLDDLLRADRLLKSGGLDERQLMEELLLRIEQRSTARAA